MEVQGMLGMLALEAPELRVSTIKGQERKLKWSSGTWFLRVLGVMVNAVAFILWAKKSHQKILSEESRDQTYILEPSPLSMVKGELEDASLENGRPIIDFLNNLGKKLGYQQR